MILIPVKDLSSAKQRLAAVLDQPRRTQLAQAMLEDVLDAVAAVPSRPAVALVTSDPFASHLAASYGFEVIPDTDNLGETQAIGMATAICRRRGAEFTLVLPGDIPLVTAAEITAVLDAARCEVNTSDGSDGWQGCVLVPAADGRGSNAILRRPCDLIPLSFGNDSFLPHRAAAEATGKACVILELAGIALDVDRAAELALLLRRKPTTRSQRLLREWKLGQAWKTPLPKLLSVRKARTQRPIKQAGASPEAD
jgi:2-phospho-L-lactate guanylyltransferase